LQELFCYERAIALGLIEEEGVFNLGMAYAKLKQTEKAIHALKRAFEISPDSAQSHYGQALVYRRTSDEKLAEQECLKAIEIDPEHTDIRFLLSTVYTDRGDIERAAEQLHKILEIKLIRPTKRPRHSSKQSIRIDCKANLLHFVIVWARRRMLI